MVLVFGVLKWLVGVGMGVVWCDLGSWRRGGQDFGCFIITKIATSGLYKSSLSKLW